MKLHTNSPSRPFHLAVFTDVPEVAKAFLSFLADEPAIVVHVVTNEIELADVVQRFPIDVLGVPRVSIPAWWECESRLTAPLTMPRLVATVVDPGWPTHHAHDLGFDGHVNADMSAPAYEHLRTLRALTEAAVTKGSRPPRDRTMLIDYPTLDEVTGADETNRKILALLSIGREDREIASAVCLSAQTVRNRMSAMLRTSGMANRTQLAVFFVHRMAQQESSGTAEHAMAIHTIYRAS